MRAGVGQAVALPRRPESQCADGRIGLPGGRDEAVLQLERVDHRPGQPGAPQPLARAPEELGLDSREVHEQDTTCQVGQQLGDGVGQRDPGRDLVVGEPVHGRAGPDRIAPLRPDDPVPRPGQHDAASVDGNPADRQHPVASGVQACRLDVDGEQGQLAGGDVRVRQRHRQRIAQRARCHPLEGAAARSDEGGSAQAHVQGQET